MDSMDHHHVLLYMLCNKSSISTLPERNEVLANSNKVEKIVQKRVNSRGQQEYRVKWKRFSENENTWEPVRNLYSCTDMVIAFNENNKTVTNTNNKEKPKDCSSKANKTLVKKKPCLKASTKKLKQTVKKTDKSKCKNASKSKAKGNKDSSTKQKDSCAKRASNKDEEDSDDDDSLYSLVTKKDSSVQSLISNTKDDEVTFKKPNIPPMVQKTSVSGTGNASPMKSLVPVIKKHIPGSPDNKKPIMATKCNNGKLYLLNKLKEKNLTLVSVKQSLTPVLGYSSVTSMTAIKPKPIQHVQEPSLGLENYIADILSYQVTPLMPTSPTTMSYEELLKNLPQHFYAKKRKRKDVDEESTSSYSDDEDEVISRRLSVRQTECVYRYKEIVVRKCEGYTQIWLNTRTKLRNALNPQVIQEIVAALNSAKYDDSRLVLFSSLGNTFCSGIDLHYLLTGDRRIAARKMADAVRELTKTLILFPKPIIAAVTGPAVGMGTSMLPLCDIVYASDKASFYMPYTQLGQTPEGCSSFTLPIVVGLAMTNELLLGGRKLTAMEASQLGLVSQVFWPTSMMQEVIPRVQHMARYSAKAMEATKLLIRSQQRTKLEVTNETECSLLLERWSSSECQRAIEQYLGNDKNFAF